jgi:hypothetical protein
MLSDKLEPMIRERPTSRTNRCPQQESAGISALDERSKSSKPLVEYRPIVHGWRF